MKKILCVLTAAVCSVSFSGCATIVDGKKGDLTVRSTPSGAQVEVDGLPAGKTPLVTEVKRKENHTVIIRKEGYLEETRMTKKGFNGWAAGNLLFGGVIGILVDWGTGALYSIKPDNIEVNLESGGTVSPKPRPINSSRSSAGRP